jgi:hypothetical protein
MLYKHRAQKLSKGSLLMMWYCVLECAGTIVLYQARQQLDSLVIELFVLLIRNAVLTVINAAFSCCLMYAVGVRTEAPWRR